MPSSRGTPSGVSSAARETGGPSTASAKFGISRAAAAGQPWPTIQPRSVLGVGDQQVEAAVVLQVVVAAEPPDAPPGALGRVPRRPAHPGDQHARPGPPAPGARRRDGSRSRRRRRRAARRTPARPPPAPARARRWRGSRPRSAGPPHAGRARGRRNRSPPRLRRRSPEDAAHAASWERQPSDKRGQVKRGFEAHACSCFVLDIVLSSGIPPD